MVDGIGPRFNETAIEIAFFYQSNKGRGSLLDLLTHKPGSVRIAKRKMVSEEFQLSDNHSHQTTDGLQQSDGKVKTQLRIGQFGLHVSCVVEQKFEIAFGFGCVDDGCIIGKLADYRVDIIV